MLSAQRDWYQHRDVDYLGVHLDVRLVSYIIETQPLVQTLGHRAFSVRERFPF